MHPDQPDFHETITLIGINFAGNMVKSNMKRASDGGAGSIEVTGARENNLRNLDISIPKNKLVVFTGVSGSGKSSLAFDTIYNEGQRRYMESFSAYARQFMGDMERPDVDQITGLSPVISIEQKTTNRNPRSTVGTVTEIYDFMRLLYARASEAYSYETGKKMVKMSEEEMVEAITERFAGEKISILAPLVRSRKGHYRELFEDLRKKGFLKVRVDGEIKDLVPKMQVDRYKIHDIEAVIDRLPVITDMKHRLNQSIQQALKQGKGLLKVVAHRGDEKSKSQSLFGGDEEAAFSKSLMDPDTGLSYDEPSPNSFSFNSPYGYCPHCKGLGTVYSVDLDAIMPDNSVSINDGGIVPLGEKRDAWIFRQVESLARKHKFPLTKPVAEIEEAKLNILLFGKDTYEDEDLSVEYSEEESGQNTGGYFDSKFEGVVPMLKRWFSTSSSNSIRDWAEGFMKLDTCPTCDGARLRKESLHFKIGGKNISELSEMELDELGQWFEALPAKLNKKQAVIAKDVLKEISDRIGFMLHVGLDYLTLRRGTKTLSGGESQRIRLATQIGSQLQGITYILDEPSIGLHQRDNHRLIDALKNLRDIGNTVLVVEHDKDIMLASDHLVDIGPLAGRHGGRVVLQGPPEEILKSHSETADYLSGKKTIAIPAKRRKGNGKEIVLKKASGHTLKNVNVKIPLGTFICVTGVSGSGKSTLINETLYPLLSNQVFTNSHKPVMAYGSIEGIEHVDKVIEIDQSPIGRTPRSNPATYCGFFTDIRQLFSSVPEAKIRGYKPGRFSFNVKGGRCETCEGGGMRVIEMNFLPDVYVHCETCQGKRYNRETLEIRYKGKSIADVLHMTVDDAVEFFQPVPYLYRKIKVLQDVGLGYITLGQSAVTLSGGEAQRVKLSTELGKRDTGKTFYILDEPTTGLHFQDIQMLLDVLEKLVERGNTVLVIEHNLDVIKVADYIIDMGPEGGKGGGKILFQGTPEELVKLKESYTGQFLKEEIKPARK